MTIPSLPEAFLREMAELEAMYLSHDDLIRQSGFGGGATRWKAERGAILDAIDGDGDLLDVGCANGYLVECLVAWGKERGLALEPYGVDIGGQLVALAKARLPQWADRFVAADAWEWAPPRRFRYVYALYDCVPEEYLGAYVHRLLDRYVAPGGRLILGAYGSRSRGTPPFDIAGFLRAQGHALAGTTTGGDPPLTAFAWIDKAIDEDQAPSWFGYMAGTVEIHGDLLAPLDGAWEADA